MRYNSTTVIPIYYLFLTHPKKNKKNKKNTALVDFGYLESEEITLRSSHRE